MAKDNLFRKSSLERISSPEQLNDYTRLTSPGVWGVLAGMTVIVLTACIWAFTETIPETVKVEGVAYSSSGGLAVYTYLPLGTAKRLEPGTPVQVSPDYAPREEYGYIYGTVEYVGLEPVTEEYITELFGTASYVDRFMPEGIAVEVRIALEGEDGGLKWSNEKGSAVTLEKGAYCSCLAVVSERKPYELIWRR